jgi:hypothetical protein
LSICSRRLRGMISSESRRHKRFIDSCKAAGRAPDVPMARGEPQGDIIHSHWRQPLLEKSTLHGVVFRKKFNDIPSAISWCLDPDDPISRPSETARMQTAISPGQRAAPARRAHRQHARRRRSRRLKSGRARSSRGRESRTSLCARRNTFGLVVTWIEHKQARLRIC